MYAYVRREDVDLCSALETAIATPGTTAMKAINEFKGRTVGWLGPKKASLTAIRMQGYLQDKTAPAHADTNRLVCLAIKNYRRIDDLIVEVRTAGGYDRSQCRYAGITDEPGFVAFDFRTADASDLWIKLGELLDVFFSIPISVQAERKQLKKAHLQHKQGNSQMSQFVTMDDL